MHGTNDAAVITGSSTAELTETNAAQSTGGDLNATDVDSPATFMPSNQRDRQQRLRQVHHRRGWHLDLPHGQCPRRGCRARTHRFPHCRHRRRHHPGVDRDHARTNDAAVITGSSTAELTETNAAQSTGGDLNATDVDSPATFMPGNQRDRQQRLRQVHHRRGWHLDLRHGQRTRRVCRRPGLPIPSLSPPQTAPPRC